MSFTGNPANSSSLTATHDVYAWRSTIIYLLHTTAHHQDEQEPAQQSRDGPEIDQCWRESNTASWNTEPSIAIFLSKPTCWGKSNTAPCRDELTAAASYSGAYVCH